MGSPFKDANAYINATGTLHSFTGHPAAVTTCMVISVLLTCYFLVKAFLPR